MIDELDSIKPQVLMFQAGCLTAKKMTDDYDAVAKFRLGRPNLEVKSSLVFLALSIPPPRKALTTKRLSEEVFAALMSLDAPRLEKSFGNYLELSAYNELDLEKSCHSLFRSV